MAAEDDHCEKNDNHSVIAHPIWMMNEKIEIVHVHNTLNLMSPAVYYAARRMKVPVVQTIHNFRLLCPGATFYRDDFSQRHILGVSDDCTVEKEIRVVFNSKEQADGFRGMCFSWK